MVYPPPTITLPDSSIPEQTTPAPTSTEGAMIPLTNIHVPPPAPTFGSGISDGDLRGAIQMLTQLVASQSQRSNVAPTSSSQQEDSTSTDPEVDPQDFIDEMHKTLRVLRATETERVELASYRLKGVVYSWFEMWEDSRNEGSPLKRWSEFVDAFMDHFLPTETKAAHVAEFENLKQGSRSVWEYHMEFVHLSKYAIHMIPTMEARARRFVQGLSPLVINEAATAALNSDMNYKKMVPFARDTNTCKLKNMMEREGGSSEPSQSYARSSSSSPPVVASQQQASCFRPNQGSRGPHLQGRSGGRFQQQRRPPCPKYGRMHLGICYMDLLVCYGCGIRGHIQMECHVSRQGVGRGTAHPSSSAAATSPAPPPARGSPVLAGRGAARRGA
ncbi:uncharacterized protein [Nicotiana sylvestris]|uniref:uncharacterized protein n=1 Tax=Nicotiana sylvestris TaxID=4096 RepID=UPI00388CDE84